MSAREEERAAGPAARTVATEIVGRPNNSNNTRSAVGSLDFPRSLWGPLDAGELTDAANALAAEGHPVDPDDLATITSYITRTFRRFGDWVLDLSRPTAAPSPASTCSPGYCSPH
jgi:hypothetical protein